MAVRRWKIHTVDTQLAAQLAEESELHPFLALLLVSRGITDPEEAMTFLLGDETDDPFSFADMDIAAERITNALDNGEKIMIYGDYDADGITATALLYSFLKDRGGNVSYRLPTREGDGYGLHNGVIDEFVQQGIQLIVTVDNGITANEAVAYANENGIDVVITDHHQPQGELPNAIAVVDPHRPDCQSGCVGYAGVGVAYMLACAIEGDTDTVMEQYGDLVAIGTLADVMPLIGSVRALVRNGLRVLNHMRRNGVRELCRAAGLMDKEITASRTVFGLAPRLNAAGRIGDPKIALELLLEQTDAAAELAVSLQEYNVSRQSTEAEILKSIEQRLMDDPSVLADRVLVIQGEDWPVGVIGILAARLTERYGKPSIVISKTDGVGKGSGRSIAGFSLFDALSACEHLLVTFGGHELAAGLTIAAENMDAFRSAINAYAKENYTEMPVPELHLTFKIKPDSIDVEKLALLSALEPTGVGNPAPVFGLFGMRLDNVTPIAGGKHVRLSFSKENTRISVLQFGVPYDAYPLICGQIYNLAITLDKNEYKGVITPTILLKDIRYADTDEQALIDAYRAFDGIVRRERKGDVLPSREQMRQVYQYLWKEKSLSMTLEQLYHHIEKPAFSLLTLRMMLEIWREAGLISVQDKGEILQISCIPTDEKSDLSLTPLWQYLEHKE